MAKIKSYDLMVDDGLVVGSFDTWEQAKESYALHIKLDEQKGITANGSPAEERYYIKVVME